MMQDWNSYRTDVLAKVGDFAKLSPDAMKSLMALSASPAKTGHLTAKVHELIALAVAVTTRCDGCIATHIKAASEQGVTREEIAEAMSVAIALNAGAAVTYTARVLEAYDTLPAA